jgi:signal transduction histidine kinase
VNRLRYAFDALIVLVAVESACEVALRHDPLHGLRTPLWLAAPAILLVVLPLLLRHRFPFAGPASVWVAAGVLSFVDGWLVVFTFGAFAAGMVASFLLGHLADAVRARLGLACVLGGGVLIVANDPDHTLGSFLFVPVLSCVGWLAGFALRERAAQATAAEERAVHAEREREAAARIAVAEERARIARELHDIVAHAMSVMVLHIGAIRHRLPDTLVEEADALRAVERTGRSALAEMRRLLSAMRQDGDGVELMPTPGLDRLDALLSEVGRAGLPVRLHIDGESVPLPQAVDLSAYRIVQEGLTNALKHARAAHADVTLRYLPGELHIEVRDDGRGTSKSDGLGHGLIGVRERVKIYGGEMTTTSVLDQGFVLRTRLPLTDDSVSARSERSEPRSVNTIGSVSARSERSEPRSANTNGSV